MRGMTYKRSTLIPDFLVEAFPIYIRHFVSCLFDKTDLINGFNLISPSWCLWKTFKTNV